LDRAAADGGGTDAEAEAVGGTEAEAETAAFDDEPPVL